MQGLKNVKGEDFSIYFGTSAETSDFIVDCLRKWWQDNKEKHSKIEELVINLDNGASQRSNRTQFIKRIVQFAQESHLKIRLIYYPPYHSKYSAVERCWVILENYWNGAILDFKRSCFKLSIKHDLERKASPNSSNRRKL